MVSKKTNDVRTYFLTYLLNSKIHYISFPVTSP